MSSIPETVWFEILTRVPVETTFVCKCVCKFMSAMISRIDFVRTHLYRSIKNNKLKFLHRTVLRSESRICRTSISKKLVVSVSHDDVLSTKSAPKYTVVSDVPFKYSDYDVHLLGSCNGVVCLMYRSYPSMYFFCLWNPVTTEYMKIPKLDSLMYFNTFDIKIRSLGYDCITDNFKLVIAARICGTNCSSSFHVFRLREKSWTTQTIPYHIPFLQGEVFLNGAFHWLCEIGGQATRFILLWDINNEEFNELQLPRITLRDGHAVNDIGVLEKCLCALVHIPTARIEVWVMQEHGSRDSWCQRYIISHEILVNQPLLNGLDAMFTCPLRMACTFKNDEILFWFLGQGYLYDPKHQRIRELSKDFRFLTRGLPCYLETLVSLDSGTYVVNRGKSMSITQKKRKMKG